MDATYVNIHTHRRTGEGIEVVSLGAGLKPPLGIGRGEFPEPPFSVGVHPYSIGHVYLKRALREVETAPAWAIGEIGLDYSIQGDHVEQKTVFAAQLRIADERGLPVVLHCVRAFEPTMEILAGFRLKGVIFHGFIGSPEQAAHAIRTGYYLSLGERSLDSPKTVEALRTTPSERLFLETDDASVTISEIYTRVAEILKTTSETLTQNIFDNYERVAGAN